MSPETEAGRALLANVRAFWNHPWSREEQIAAIEAEARSLAIDRAVEAITAMPHPTTLKKCICHEGEERFTSGWDEDRAAVIEKLESLR